MFMKSLINRNNIILFLFLNFNVFIVAVLSLYSENLWLELYKFFQFIVFLLLIFYFFYKIQKVFAFIFLVCVNLLYLFLLFYFIITGSHLSFDFLQLYFDASIFNIVIMYMWPILFLFVATFLNVVGFIIIKNKILNRGRILLFSLFLFILFSFQAFYVDGLNNEIFVFARSIYGSDKVIDHYQKKYEQLVRASVRDKDFILNQTKSVNKENLPDFLDNIIILQIESLNNFLVNEKNTPNFWSLAQEGVWFKKFYGNSVQTILAQENILCGLPTSFESNLSENEEVSNILCLPEFLNSLDYKTFFMKSFDLRFADTGKLMSQLKFDEIHADSIMQEEDKVGKWGYREDIFLKRAFDHLEEKKQDKYNFAYIEVGPTNHWPFTTPDDLKSLVPYKEPKNHQERLMNTTFLQDMFLRDALLRIDEMFPEKNYTLFVLSDHSWPAEIHGGNNFNEKGSFEENFLTSMVVKFGGQEDWRSKKIETAYSQMDILPGIFDLFGVNHQSDYLAKTFMEEIRTGRAGYHKIVLVQPFATKYINIIEHGTGGQYLKRQYSFDNKRWFSYDLEKDPMEEDGEIITNLKKNNLKAIGSFLPLLTGDHLIAHALGGIDGYTYTNSREAFMYNYQNGKRLFEVDLVFIDDQELVAAHDIPAGLDLDGFKSKKIDGKYTPLSFDDIVKIMEDYSDVKLVVDIKDDFNRAYNLIINRLGNRSDLLYRIVPQVYNEDNYNYLQELFLFPEMIYTLYLTDSSDGEVYDFIKKNNNIKYLAVNPRRFSEKLTGDLNKLGVWTFVYTLNTDDEIRVFLEKGVSGVYTDFY